MRQASAPFFSSTILLQRNPQGSTVLTYDTVVLSGEMTHWHHHRRQPTWIGPTDISRLFSWASVVDEDSPSTDTTQGCGLHSTTRRFCLFGIRRPRPMGPATPRPRPCMMAWKWQRRCILISEWILPVVANKVQSKHVPRVHEDMLWVIESSVC